ncbi:MAG: helix-turn-helix transcriptional regulator [Candidatus Eisenbacteria bacterium]|nr:helix-turn-helix transcriptional regulator [Candidatus Eisenbacteria bacterium]
MTRPTLRPHPRAIEALASPVRQDLVVLLENSPPLAVTELARRLGRRPDALYHHLRALQRAGLVERDEPWPCLQRRAHRGHHRTRERARLSAGDARGGGPRGTSSERAPLERVVDGDRAAGGRSRTFGSSWRRCARASPAKSALRIPGRPCSPLSSAPSRDHPRRRAGRARARRVRRELSARGHFSPGSARPIPSPPPRSQLNGAIGRLV